MQALLIIDMPSSCHTCRLEHLHMCMGTDIRHVIQNSNKRLAWCPLHKPLKMVTADYYIYRRPYLFKNIEREYKLIKGLEEI